VFVIILLAPEGLQVWLGGAFPAQSTRVVQLLAVGVLLNGVAQIPFVLLQGAGRASWTAKLHVLELVPYVVLAWWLIGRLGVTGAALAWSARCAVDAAAVLVLAGRVTPVPRAVGWWLAGAVAACAVAAAAYELPLALRLALAPIGALGLLAALARGLGVGDHVAALRRRVARV
jgi:O-antigen/teichoic acid export membrane protein